MKPIYALDAFAKFAFPIHANSKEPATKNGHLDAPQPVADGQNYGISLDRSDLIVLDVDDKNHIDGHESLDEVGHTIPDTFSVCTPSGGKHYYFRRPATHTACRSIGPLLNIDVLSRGYVVGPGSEIDGRPYEVENDLPIADAPEWLLRLNAPKSQEFAACDKMHDLDPATEKPATAEQVKAYLEQSAPIATQGRSGHNTLLEVVDSLYWGFKLDPSDCEKALWQWYNPRCSPPWDPSGNDRKDFAHKIRQVAKRESQRGPGFMLEASDEHQSWIEDFCKGLEARYNARADAHAPAEQLSPAIVDDLLAHAKANRYSPNMAIPRRRCAIKLGGRPIAHAGNIGVISANPKAGKSSLIAGAIATCLSGQDHLGWSAGSTSGAVLHFDTEQSKEDFKRMGDGILDRAGFNEAPARLYSYHLRELSPRQLIEIIEPLIEQANAEQGSIHSIWIDGIGDYLDSLNDDVAANGLVLKLLTLSAKYSTFIMNVIHFNPGSGKTRGHLGSSLERKAEANVILKKEDGVTKIYGPSFRGEPIEERDALRMSWSTETNRWEMLQSKEEERHTKQTMELLEYLREIFSDNPPSLSKNEIVSRLANDDPDKLPKVDGKAQKYSWKPIPLKTAYTKRKNMEDAGLISCTVVNGQEQYRLTSKARDAAESILGVHLIP